MFEERDPLAVIAQCLKLLKTIDVSKVSKRGQRAVQSLTSYSKWVVDGGSTVDWGEAGENALGVLTKVVKTIWPSGKLEPIEDPVKTLAEISDLLRFSGFGPREGL